MHGTFILTDEYIIHNQVGGGDEEKEAALSAAHERTANKCLELARINGGIYNKVPLSLSLSLSRSLVLSLSLPLSLSLNTLSLNTGGAVRGLPAGRGRRPGGPEAVCPGARGVQPQTLSPEALSRIPKSHTLIPTPYNYTLNPDPLNPKP